MMSAAFESVLTRAEQILARLEQHLPPLPQPPPWESATAFRWLGSHVPQPVQAVKQPPTLALADMLCIDKQKTLLDRNTRQFIQGLPANHALLWGSRGTGKSSLIKALLHEYSAQGLRLLEVEPQYLHELPAIVALLADRPEKFILYCDDLSFEADDARYKRLKAVLEGAIGGLSENALVYATSNRRHLLPEYQSENHAAQYITEGELHGEIHHSDTVEEKISLSERFGVWLSFRPFTQDEYLTIVQYWLQKLDSRLDDWPAVRLLALRFALQRGSRSGRVASQFARDWVGQTQVR